MAQKYAAEGWQVEVEGLRSLVRPDLGRADLMLTRGAERWAVEVETGKSNSAENVRSALRAGVAR